MSCARGPRLVLALAIAFSGVAWYGTTTLRGGSVADHSSHEASQTVDWRERAAGPGIVPFPQIGSLARDFELPILHDREPWLRGDSMTLSELRGRWVYLDVFGTWCGPCQEKYPAMEEIARDVAAEGGIVIGLLLEDRPKSAAAWFTDHGGIAYPFLVLDDVTARQWRIVGAPMGFLISPDGRIARRCVGCAIEGERVEDLAEEIRHLQE